MISMFSPAYRIVAPRRRAVTDDAYEKIRQFQALAKSFAQRYPAYDVDLNQDGSQSISLAVPGFSADDIKVTRDSNGVTISGEKSEETISSTKQVRGINRESFSHSFGLSAESVVESATYENGIITLRIIRNEPENPAEKIIPVTIGAVSQNATPRADAQDEGAAE